MAFSPLIMSQTTPVPILKQINRVNDDGSYTYGFESGDGTFRLETRDSNGNIRGKYAYYDETGDMKTVEYAAGEPTQTKGGFEARGPHIPELPQSAPHDPSEVFDEEPEQLSKFKTRAKNLKNPTNWNNQQPHHNPSPLNAFLSSDSGNWQASAPQHRFNAPKQRSMWDQGDINAPKSENNGARRGFSFGFEVPDPAPRNHAANNKFNQQSKQSAFDINYQNFPSSF